MKLIRFKQSNGNYRIVHNCHRLYNVYDYFASESEESRNASNLLFHIEKRTKELSTYSSYLEKDRLTYDIFQSESHQIQKEDVPAKTLECLLNLQRTKVANVIPYAEIKHNEDHHLAALQKNINEYVDELISNIYNLLDKSKKTIERIAYPFIANESSIKNGCKIYYKYPNTDGIIRPTFKEYFNYLFNKLYPIPTIEYHSIEWIQYTVHELLCKKYPFMQINYVGTPNYIEVHLPIKEVLH